NGNASAAKNAAKFLSKLQDVHADVKLTHDQVQAALLGLVEKRFLQCDIVGGNRVVHLEYEPRLEWHC
ncbi:hypothetical protein PF008_g26480, partial [Phytophthora fragariae]